MATILVADDNSNIQKMVTLALKDQGIEVQAVGNGEAAVRKLADLQPDLVLADIFMPVRNGYEVCEFIKQDTRFAHIPVILLAGAFDPFDEREAQRVGADGVLKKPFIPPDPLISMVKSVLAKSAGQRLVPVAAAVASPVAATAALEPEPPAESPAEEYSTHPQRVSFRENETPLAFGELLATPTVEAEAEPEQTTQPETGFSEMRFWQGPATVGEAPPEPHTPEPSSSAADPAPLVESEAVPEMANSAPELTQAAPAETAEAPTPTEIEPPSMTPADEGEASGWAEAAEGPAAAWSSPVAPAALSAEPALASVDPAPQRADSVQSFGVPQPADPELVDEVVTRVIERMQPQVLEIVTREILRPVVEALVRRELEKR